MYENDFGIIFYPLHSYAKSNYIYVYMKKSITSKKNPFHRAEQKRKNKKLAESIQLYIVYHSIIDIYIYVCMLIFNMKNISYIFLLPISVLMISCCSWLFVCSFPTFSLCRQN